MIDFFGYIFMFLDHIFKFLNMKINNFNPTIGTLAFPIFAYMAARGFRKTRDKDKYLKRLLIFSFVSQIPYILMIFGLPNLANIKHIGDKIIFVLSHFTQSLNIGFTFVVALLTIKLIQKENENIVNKILYVTIFLLVAQIMKLDYKAYGVALIIMFYFNKKLPKLILFMSILNAANVLLIYFAASLNRQERIYNAGRQAIGILALPLIYYLGIKLENKTFGKKEITLGNKKKINKNKKILKILKYSIYPIHMFLIFLSNYFNLFA